MEQRFSLLRFSIYGCIGGECHAFYSRLNELLVEKGGVQKPVIITGFDQKFASRY